MIKKHKFIIAVCILAIFCNFIVKISIIDRQVNKILFLQQSVAAARSDKYLKTGKPKTLSFAEQDDIKKIFLMIPENFLFTESASQIRAFIDKNHLAMEESLIFKPEETKMTDLLKYNTNINITGDYVKIKKMVSDIQNMQGLICINSARISRTKDHHDKIRLNLALSIFLKRKTA